MFLSRLPFLLYVKLKGDGYDVDIELCILYFPSHILCGVISNIVYEIYVSKFFVFLLWVKFKGCDVDSVLFMNVIGMSLHIRRCFKCFI